jgi:hypothetical protein
VQAPEFQGVRAAEVAPKVLQGSFPDSTVKVVSNDLIDIKINDKPGENFYLIDVKAKRYRRFLDPQTLKFDSTLVLEPIEFNNLNKIFLSDLEIVSKQTYFELFDDRLFNGKDYTLQVEIPAEESQRNPIHTEAQYYLVSVKSISKSYFEFLRNFLVARPIYGGPFESYREVPTNVMGGAGIFGLYSEIQDTVFIKK